MDAIGEAKPREQLRRACPILPLTARKRRQQKIVERAQARHQMKILEDCADMPTTVAIALAGRQGRHVAPGDLDMTFEHIRQSRDGEQQGCLARSRRPGQQRRLAIFHLQMS
ncbi:hypothetical protein Sj15T_11880 [Sphingobium sp. TA15]|nr:hypothetical protein Sj15T_11880 [Sphingobium sp. TA15]